MKTNQKGITLIALVITIIVLLILAGVSIAMLTGENGILTRTNEAKVSQIEGQVREEINLAVQAAKMYAEQKAVETDTGFLAEEQEATIVTEMQKDLTTPKGYTVTAGEGAVNINYTTTDYEAATNHDGANITVTITLDGNTFNVGAFTYNRGE